MLFEEFFKKKRIDLDALQKAEQGLFSEFKTHYEAMGEKSFDHTKKYWFNKLRLQFPLAIEIKTEKPKIDNPLAEQTITESLLEQTSPSPKLGFVPKFKANVAKPVDDKPKETTPPAEEQFATPAPKVGFTPRFKATNTTKPSTEETKPVGSTEEVKPEDVPVTPAPKVGFTPRFKAANMPKPASIADEPKEEIKTEEPIVEIKAETQPAIPAPKLGFTPKFKTANMPKPAVGPEKTTAPESSENTTPASPDNSETKPAYKPRFNMKNLPKKEE